MNDALPIHGGQLRELAERFGISASDLLDFSANINPEGPPASVIAALRAGLDNPASLFCYPDLRETELRRSIARYTGVGSENIVAANGFVPLLEAALRALPIRRCLVPVPAFLEYRKTLMRARVKIIPYVLPEEYDFGYDAEELFNDEQDAVLLANPQNPSGVVCSRETMLRILAVAEERNICVLLDEAFIDYLPEYSATLDVDRFKNLIVFRSVTKFYGFPGLRVAYAVADPGVAASIDENLPPWPITTLAARAVCAALEDEPYADRARALNRERRSQLQHDMEALGIHVYPSAANFLLLRVPSDINAAALWERMIAEHRIVLRSCANYEALSAGHLRAAVRTEEENARLVEALAESLRSLRARPEFFAQHTQITRRGFGIGLFSAAIAAKLPDQRRPLRIISTAPSITETLFALGLGGQVVGVSRFCDFPPEVRSLPKVGTYLRPDPEAIARLAPDLVVLEQNSSELTNRLNALHIAFVEVPHATLNDVFATMQIIGKAAGVSERAAALAGQLKGSLDGVQAKARALPSPRVLAIVDRGQGALTGLVGVGPGNYENQLLEIAGGTNVLAKPGVPEYPPISMETVLRENPEVILDLSSSHRSEGEDQKAIEEVLSLWRQQTELAAVRNGRVYAGTSNALVVPGPRAAEAAQRFFEYLHGNGAENQH